jgi:hypothetical protein
MPPRGARSGFVLGAGSHARRCHIPSPRRPSPAPTGCHVCVRVCAARRFDTIYCDGSIRIAQDIRGDTLIVERDGLPRIFT